MVAGLAGVGFGFFLAGLSDDFDGVDFRFGVAGALDFLTEGFAVPPLAGVDFLTVLAAAGFVFPSAGAAGVVGLASGAGGVAAFCFSGAGVDGAGLSGGVRFLGWASARGDSAAFGPGVCGFEMADWEDTWDEQTTTRASRGRNDFNMEREGWVGRAESQIG